MSKNRADEAYEVRRSAADMARHRPQIEHKANSDEHRYASAHYPMSFTKGLHHEEDLGVVAQCGYFEAFRNAIDEGYVEPFTSRLHVPTKYGRRKWEAPTAGIVYDLQGPDAQAVTMPPAPELCSAELDYEMAEVYELALLRDVPFNQFDPSEAAPGELQDSVDRLNQMQYTADGFDGRPRKANAAGQLDQATAFRGSSPGVEVGPYLSQFLLMGNEDQAGQGGPDSGLIVYGAQTINQRVPRAQRGDDYMTSWETWFNVQQGYDVNECGPGQRLGKSRCFIHRPRDLATYVHFDALYQAYLNAALILLGQGAPFDPGFAKLSGMRPMYTPDNDADGLAQNAGGFALYGGPHILTLVTEVATRALKAVRYQKFNNHLRLRPEALAGRLARAEEIDERFPSTCGAFTKMRGNLGKTLEAIVDANPADGALPNGNLLLPMAFREGSPMHPTYGAGHATVAGACVTILKAFFDTGAILGQSAHQNCTEGRVGFFHVVDKPLYFVTDDEGKELHPRDADKCPLTLEGELNKLAANISIGRNMAGVHYFSDYYDSLRMGEEIAIGMLQEQALCYPTDDFVMSIPTFDGDTVRVGRK